MRTYARILNGVVVELFTTAAAIGTLFNPAIIWVDVTGNTTVQIGWVQQSGGGFVAPPTATVPTGAAVAVVSLANLQAQLSALQAELTALTNAAAGNP
jgi:hypothetical protein